MTCEFVAASSYTIKPRKPQKSDIQVITNEEPPTPAVYAVVNKQNKSQSCHSCNTLQLIMIVLTARSLARNDNSVSSDISNGKSKPVPPPPPKYMPDPPPYTASDEYVPMDVSGTCQAPH